MKTYRLIKDTPELKVGATVEEVGEFETSYECRTKKFQKKKDQGRTTYSKQVVEDSPSWFEEVKPIWVKADEVKKVKDFISKLQKHVKN